METWKIFGMILLMGVVASYPSFANDSNVEKKARKLASEPEEEQMVESFSCARGQDVRRYEVHTKGTGCRAQYFKAGGSREIASFRKGVESCREIAQKSRDTLARSQYQCK